MTFDIFEPLNKKEHNRNTFDCGNPALNQYLKQQAGQDQDKRYAVTWVLKVAEHSEEIVAYYTLSNTSLLIDNFTEDERKQLRLTKQPHIPAILLGRLAVDRRYQGNGIGKVVLWNALWRAHQLSQTSGCLLFLIDAKDDRTRDWYVKKFEFMPLRENGLTVYLHMKTVDELFQEAS